MLPLKLVRSLVLGEPITNRHLQSSNHHACECDNDEQDDVGSHSQGDHHHHHDGHNKRSRRRRKKSSSSDKSAITRTPSLLFLPTKEIVTDTYRLATLARDIGMDLHPSPSLSHIIFSYPSPYPSPSSSASTSTSSPSPIPFSWSSTSSFSSLPDEAVPLPFPYLATASVSLLRHFVRLSKGLFKLAFLSSDYASDESRISSESNWNCCSTSLFSRLTFDRINTMDDFSRTLAGKGWTLFKTNKNPQSDSIDRRVCGGKSVYLFRKMDSNRVRARRENGSGATNGECRIRELKLPELDFENAPLRILQYILLMTDDVFYLA